MYYRARPVRPPVEIAAPPFPRDLPWVNVAPLRMDQQIGRPVLVEFWDFCRPNSMRTLPYVREWHRRYEGDGLRVIGVHTSGFPPSASEDAVRAAVARLEINWPVAIDVDYGCGVVRQRGLARPLPVTSGGPCSTTTTARAPTTRRARDPAVLAWSATSSRPCPGGRARRRAVPQTADVEGPYSGPYAAGGVWAVLDGGAPSSPTAARSRCQAPAPTPSWSTTGTPRASRPDGGPGRDMRRHLLHPRRSGSMRSEF